MRRSVLISVVASSAVSALVTALVMLAMLPSLVDAQVAKLSASSLELTGEHGQGVTAEVGPPGGGIVRVLGSDGKTVRLSLNSSGQPGPSGIAANAGMNVYNVGGLEVARLGSIASLNGYGLNLRDAQGNTRYRVAVDGDGNATVQLYDADGNVIWSAP